MSWIWNFGNGSEDLATSVGWALYIFPADGTYPVTVTLTVTDNAGGSDSASMTLEISHPQTVGDPPVAGFSFTTTDLTADFTDASTDDGTISWSWDFADGNSSTAQNPSHAYGSAGSYDVTLTVIDNDNNSNNITKTVAVTAPPPPPGSFTLSTSPYKVKGVQHVALEWTGANGATVVISREGVPLTLDPSDPVEDGNYDDNINQKGGGSYTYQVCILDAPDVCSNLALAVF